MHHLKFAGIRAGTESPWISKSLLSGRESQVTLRMSTVTDLTSRDSALASFPVIPLWTRIVLFGRRANRRSATMTRLQRKSRAPYLSWLLSLILVVQTCALPIPLAFLLISPEAEAMTRGCAKKTCCTALCYLDKNGVHHCVHLQNEHRHHADSCECGVAIHDQAVNLILHSTPGTIPETERPSLFLVQNGWISQTPVFAETHDPATPSPPPR